MFQAKTGILGTGFLMATLPVAHAGDIPPEGSKPLSEIVRSVEGRNLGVITEVEFERGLWEVEIQKGGQETTLSVDPKTGEMKPQPESTDHDETLPPEGSKRLSEVIKTVEARDLGTITEVDFEDGHWEFEIRVGAKKIKLDVDPKTGKDRSR